MKKINVFTMIALLFSVFSLFSDEIPDESSDEIPDESSDEIPDDIPDEYEFLFFDKFTEPDENCVYFDGNSCCGDCSEKNEVQGITSIDDDFWILSKNNWIYTFELESNSSLFSTSIQTDYFENNNFDYDNHVKFCDIDFFDNHLYVPNGQRIDIFEWNNGTKKFGRNPISWDIDEESFSVAIHPYSRHIFYKMNGTKTRVLGKKIVNNELAGCFYRIAFRYKNGEILRPTDLTDHFTRQGMTFSPSGRFFLFCS